MSKPKDSLAPIVRVVFVVLLGILTLSLSVLFLIFFVPVVTWYIWRLSEKNADLERRVAALENPGAQKPEKA